MSQAKFLSPYFIKSSTELEESAPESAVPHCAGVKPSVCKAVSASVRLSPVGRAAL